MNAIASRISGTVTAVYVENNQRVERGKLAVELDTRDYQVALSQ
jgi:multidrug resistance efflux pump